MALYIRRLSSLPMMDFEADLGWFLLIYSKDMRMFLVENWMWFILNLVSILISE